MTKLLLPTLTLLAVNWLAPATRAQDLRINPGQDDSRARANRSNPQVLAAFRPVVAKVAQSIVRVQCDGKAAALGTVVHGDGYILTKASELKAGKLTVKDYDGREFEATRVTTHDVYDFALLKVKAKDLPPVSWSPSLTAPVGNWVASAGPGDDAVAVGVVSVAARSMPTTNLFPVLSPNGPYMGVLRGDSDYGAKLGSVSSGTPAHKAGLKDNDIVVSLNSKPIANFEELSTLIQTFKPGDTVRVVVHRGESILEKSVKLERRPADQSGNRGNVQNNMGSELSARHTGFPTILQHDTVIKPTDCGGPLVDLDGRVVGINIARAGRVESYAIPSEVVVPIVAELISGRANSTATTSNTPKSPAERVKAARDGLRLAEAEKAAADTKVAAAKAALDKALADEKAANGSKDENK